MQPHGRSASAVATLAGVLAATPAAAEVVEAASVRDEGVVLVGLGLLCLMILHQARGRKERRRRSQKRAAPPSG